MNLQLWLEEFCELGFVIPSSRQPFWQFSWNWRISFFFWTLHGVWGPYRNRHDKAGFFSKISPSGKNDQKWPLNRVFQLFREIKSLVLSENGLKLKYLWSFNILRKLHAREIWFSSMLMVFLKNVLIVATGLLWAWKWCILIILVVVRIAFNFFTMKEAKRKLY